MVEKPAKTQLLDVGERGVTQLDVPLEPELLKTGEIAVVGVKDSGKCLESGDGLSLRKEDQPRKEAGIVFHGKDLGAMAMPFCAIVEDTEVVPCSTLLALVPKEGLGAEKPIGKVWMDEDLFGERENVAVVVQSFPIGQSHVLDGEASCNATQDDWRGELADAGWVHI